jgi:Flp pilus assembly protein TadG
MAMKQFLKDQSGELTIIASMGMVVILAFAGLAIDVGHLRYAKGKLQMAADAAAVAAALEVKNCGGTANCSSMQAAAQAALNENGLTGSTIVTNCATGTATGLQLMINNPACYTGASDPNAGKSGVVEVVVTQPEPMYFATVLGFKSFPIGARSEAGPINNGNCIYALDPNGGNAITVDLLASVSANCGVVDESNAWNAFSCNLLAATHANNFSITGGVEGLLCGMSPSPKTNQAVPTPADPLAYLPTPAVGACGTSTKSPYYGSSSQVVVALGSATLNPGVYCGGISVAALANVTFNPGTYILTSTQGGINLLGLHILGTGGLNIDVASNVTGNGVTFYNYGPQGSVAFTLSSVTLGSVKLTAPTTGTYAGILFFQDPGNTNGATIVGSSALNTDLEGAFYFPTAKVSYAVSGPSKYNILVAYDIEFLALTFGGNALTSSFANDTSALVNGSPIASTGLIQ